MQTSKKELYFHENIIFDSEYSKNIEPIIETEIVDIMDIPGPPHEKLLALSKML